MPSVAAPRVVNIEDLRRLARGRVPRPVFEYVDGGAEGEVTLRENCRAFESITFRPRHAVPVQQCDLRTTILGQEISFPAILAPVGYSRVMHPEGECAAARAAGEAGTIYTLSTLSGHKLENVKASSSGPVWYQLYLIGGRDLAERAIDRARRAGFSALVVTIDTAVSGIRERDIRNGVAELLSGNVLSMIPFLPQVLARPAWLAGFLRDGGVPKLENVLLADGRPMPLIDVATALSESAVTWEDMRWLRDAWPGPIIIKGVLTGNDARRAMDEGAAAVVVSNHGGRQLDCSPATLRVLPEVLDAVGGRIEVLMDGGIRRGTDIIKAVCLGAKAVLFGRAYAWGLCAGGHAGVARAIEILRADVDRSMKLLGCTSMSQLDRSYLNLPAGWPSQSC